MAELGDRLGPLLLQLPPSFTVEGMGVLEDFLKGLPEGFRYAVEVRHRSWLGSDLPEMLRERGVALTLIDYPRRSEEHTSELQSRQYLVCRLLLEKKTIKNISSHLLPLRLSVTTYYPSTLTMFTPYRRSITSLPSSPLSSLSTPTPYQRLPRAHSN